MTGASTYFSSTYAEARSKFWDAGEAAGARMNSHQNPASGPNGETLTTDLAWFGPEHPDRMLLILSATHGAEGFLGSGIEVGFLRNGFHRELPTGMACVVLHALNPFGFAWQSGGPTKAISISTAISSIMRARVRRTPATRRSRDAICPADWLEAGRAAADATLRAYGAEHGAVALQAAITSGQYRHADGVFYGGTAASWSNQLLSADRGGSPATRNGSASSTCIAGSGPTAMARSSTAITPTGGDCPGPRLVRDGRDLDRRRHLLLRAGRRRHRHGHGAGRSGGRRDRRHHARIRHVAARGHGQRRARRQLAACPWPARFRTEGRAIKSQIRYAFYPDKDDWKSMAWERAVDVARRMVKGLAES